MYDDWDGTKDELDRLYDKLDETIKFISERLKGGISPDTKHYTELALITLMMDEVPLSDIRIYNQIGSSWVAEVKYRGINFIYAAGKNMPEGWAEFYQK